LSSYSYIQRSLLTYNHQVTGSRFTDKYLASRNSYSRSSYPMYPTRTPASPKSPKPAAATATPALPGSPGSPSRKVVTEFAAFGAPKNASVFGTAVQSTPFSLAGGKAAFGTVRTGPSRASFDDDDDDDDDGRQRVELRDDPISLDQVCVLVITLTLMSDLFLHRLNASRCRALGEAFVPRNYANITCTSYILSSIISASLFAFNSHRRYVLLGYTMLSDVNTFDSMRVSIRAHHLPQC
jgi:hypothetical protein